MKVYTVKDEDGNLYPRAILTLPKMFEGVIDKKIVQVDYGLDDVNEYLSKNKELSLAVCELTEIK